MKNRCLQTMVLRILLRAPWTARRSNQSSLREINPEYSLEGLLLKLKLQYFGHLMGKLQEMVRDREAWQYYSPRGCKEADTTG